MIHTFDKPTHHVLTDCIIRIYREKSRVWTVGRGGGGTVGRHMDPIYYCHRTTAPPKNQPVNLTTLLNTSKKKNPQPSRGDSWGRGGVPWEALTTLKNGGPCTLPPNRVIVNRMTNLTLLPTSIPADMVLRIAQGLEEPLEVASDHGYDEATYELLEQQDWFRSAIISKKNELERDGFVLKYKAGVYAENLMENVYSQARGEDVRLSDRLDALKYFSDIAGLKPKEAFASGPGFSITINMADGADISAPVFQPLEATTEMVEAEMVVDVPLFEPADTPNNVALYANIEEPPEEVSDDGTFELTMPGFD